MALKLETKTLEGLPAEIAALYAPDPSGSGYALDIVDAEHGSSLLHALRIERTARKSAEAALKTAGLSGDDATAAVAAAARERDEARARAATLARRMFDARVAELAQAAGLHAAAIGDAQRAAREMFQLADDGASLVAKDGSDTTPTQWLETQRGESPHWFPAAGSGSGSRGMSRDAFAPVTTMTRAHFDSMTPHERAAFVADGGTIR